LFFLSSLISHLLISLLFLLASKSATEACFFTFFTFCGRCMVVFVVKKEKKKNQTKGISHSRRRHSCDALSRVREPVYSHTHTHCIYLCNLQNPKSTLDQNARTSKKSLFVFLVCYKRVIHQYLLEEQKHGDEESDAVGHGESRRRCPRWYPRNRHTEYVFTLVLIGG